MNYVDVILGALLVLAFIKGFSGGLWRSIFNLVSTAAAFVGTYFLVGPAVNLIEKNYKLLASMASWWKGVFGSMPGLALPYNPATFDQAFAAASNHGWMSIFQTAIRNNVLAVQEAAGANPTWGTVLGLALARLILSGIVFLILLAVLRLACNLVAGSLAFGIPKTLSSRVLGGILETAISVVWLSIMAGTLSPLLTTGILSGVGKGAETSTVFAFLMGAYRAIWPVVLAQIK